MYTHGQIVFAGVDTHLRAHHAAVVDALGRHLGDKEFTADTTGYDDLIGWVRSFGQVTAIGIEGTGSWGAQLTRTARAIGLQVIEVDRPDRKARRRSGKSDPLDAYAAAIAVASGRADTTPKTRDGQVEAIRALRVARTSAVKARTQAVNQMRALLTTAHDSLRTQFRAMPARTLAETAARLRPGTDLADPTHAVKAALRHLARRYLALSAEISELDNELAPLVAHTAPDLLARFGVGPETAGQLLVTAGDNPDRLRSEAAFAHLCGVAPVPASSGRTHRHRLNRGGDRQANHALHVIVLTRMAHDPATRAYFERRTAQGLSRPDIIRCLKRYVAREIYHVLANSPAVSGPPDHEVSGPNRAVKDAFGAADAVSCAHP